MTPAEAELRVSATAGGICNAVAFWFQLQLDSTTSLSTSPYADKARMHQHNNGERLLIACCIMTNYCKEGLMMTIEWQVIAFDATFLGTNEGCCAWGPGSNLAAGGAVGRRDAGCARGLPHHDRCPRYLWPLISHPKGCNARPGSRRRADASAGARSCGPDIAMAVSPAKSDHRENVGIGSCVEGSSGRCECSQRSALARGCTKPAGVPGGCVRSAAPGRAAA